MTPLVLLFIGLSVKLSWQQVKAIFSFLFFRSTVAFFLSGLLLLILPVHDLATIILVVVFPQSACSFWPYAHMVAVNSLEDKQANAPARTFDLDFGMNVLACSMPFSVILILGIYLFEGFFAETANVFFTGTVFIVLAILPLVFSFRWFQSYGRRIVRVWK